MTKEVSPEGTTPNGSGGTEKVELDKKVYDKLVEDIATANQNVANVVDEIKDLRKKNQELKEIADGKKPEPTEVEKAVQAEIARRDAAEAKSNYETASQSFLRRPEFSKENDPDGSKFKAFEAELKDINLAGKRSIEEFTRSFEKAASLAGITEKKTPIMNPQDAHTPREGGQPHPTEIQTELPAQEAKLVKEKFGGDTKKYLEAKAKRPEYFETLLQWVK